MINNFDIVKLHFTAPLHISKGRDDYSSAETVLHSDTLKSAIFASAVQLYGNQYATIDFFESFAVSSAFPFWENKLFFPKPLMFANITVQGKAIEKNAKKLKKIQWFEKPYFEQLLQGIHLELPENHIYGSYAAQFNEAIELNCSQHLVRVAIANHDEPKPFYIERTYFQEKAGLFFMIKYPENQSDKTVVQQAIRYLGENGIGTDKNVGNGQFLPENATISLQIPQKADYSLALALFCPQDSQKLQQLLSTPQATYQLIKRGGWLASPQNENLMSFRKKSIYMFSEGSIFYTNTSLQGKTVNLMPEILSQINQKQPVWRDGTGWFIPINL